MGSVLTQKIILAITLLWLATPAEAGWLIDNERFHVSVHGQLSCQDCHEGIRERKHHPNPVDVNKNLRDFFELEECTSCHDDVTDKISEGRHGGQEATLWQRFENCIECHDPHYQIREKDEAGGPILNRPVTQKCSRCHKIQAKLPDFSDEDQACLQCHLAVNRDDPQSDQKADHKIGALCLHCHSSDGQRQAKLAESHPLIDPDQYASTPHMDVACLECHPGAAEFGHGDQMPGDCRQCHFPHDEKVAHDAHAEVSCGACHLEAVTPVRGSGSGIIGWRKPTYANRISPIHQMQVPLKAESCRTCHKKNNSIGAAAMVLPAKSIICMPCHAATFSVGDTITVSTLLFFVLGLLGVGSIWLSGGNKTTSAIQNFFGFVIVILKAVFSTRIIAITKSLVMDGLVQRRLFRVSRERWVLHAMIFYPFVFRFMWGMIGLIASLWWPQWSGTWTMLNKNNPLTAFMFDLSGLIVILGVIGVLVRRQQSRLADSTIGLPAADWPAYALLGGILIGGFILEGMRMAMTDSPGGAAYAFVGDAISRMLNGFELTGIYGYVWYLHAILTGAFVIYLPFSRMFHMIIAPINLALNAADEAGKLGSYKAGKL